MSQTFRVAFIGNRTAVWKQCAQFSELQIERVFAVEDSFLAKHLAASGTPFTPFKVADKKAIFAELHACSFDVLISNGCPLKLPIDQLADQRRVFLNVHPSYLPWLKGIHPINGALLFDESFAGATMHFMDQGIDTGPIVYQDRFELTPDVDLGLLYRLLFDFEGAVFSEGMKLLVDSNFRYRGITQTGAGSYYSRKPGDAEVNFCKMQAVPILNRIRAFGVRSLGTKATLLDRVIRIFEAQPITNSHVLARFSNGLPGQVMMEYENKLLVRCVDGIVKVVLWDHV
ncbi:MAG: hypothetical protein JNM18_07770 [Planctomycetaceae bacterium]|nr:hypothetical protein [Planctomycetaceae bacterium]